MAPAGRGAQVVLKGGDTLQADRVLLATGNLAPHDLIPPGPVHEHPAYCATRGEGGTKSYRTPRRMSSWSEPGSP